MWMNMSPLVRIRSEEPALSHSQTHAHTHTKDLRSFLSFFLLTCANGLLSVFFSIIIIICFIWPNDQNSFPFAYLCTCAPAVYSAVHLFNISVFIFFFLFFFISLVYCAFFLAWYTRCTDVTLVLYICLSSLELVTRSELLTLIHFVSHRTSSISLLYALSFSLMMLLLLLVGMRMPSDVDIDT